ncbi:MAG: hypothetical protein WC701_07770 [Kiritimatiellales bacterium]|jgi:hypothetical protein
MNSLNHNENSIAGLECWIETMRTGSGYGGPSVGSQGISIDYCGAAFDWRYEGLLDGYAARYRSTRRADYLDRIERDLLAITSAQLINGTFRNSWFDLNPYEGGMPHEPAMLAAACRARKLLIENGRTVPSGFDKAVELFAETRLLNELWNRLLHTFNDWLQSSFEYFTPHSVAAAVELLIEYAELGGDWKRLEYYITGAADSLLAVQCTAGAFSGGIPLTSRRGSAFSPAMAARCAPALIKTAQTTGQEKYRRAAEALAGFVRRNIRPDGGFAFVLSEGRPPQQFPVILGAAADVVNSFDHAGLSMPDDSAALQKLLNGKQMANGAFPTAVGFGNSSGKIQIPDWRDILPCCGWQDKIYCFLSRHHSGTPDSFSPADIRLPVRIPGGRGEYIETGKNLYILNRHGKPVYHWEKGAKWALVNLI